MQDRTKPGNWRVVLGSLAGAGIAALLFGLLPEASLRWRADLRTGTAEQLALDLPDGSRLQLAPRSAVLLDFGPGRRGLQLLAGEALVTVAAGPPPPLRLQAGAALATTTAGTVAISLRQPVPEVGLRAGTVQVEAPQAMLAAVEQLAPGDRAQLTTAGRWQRSPGAPADVAAWVEGRLVAEDATVGRLAAQLRPVLPGWLLVSDAAAATRLSGRWALQPPEAALQAIAAGAGLRLRQVTPWLTLLSAD